MQYLTDKQQEDLLGHLTDGKSSKSWCERHKEQPKKVYRTLQQDTNFRELYKLAKSDSADTLADMIIEVCEKLENKTIDPHSARVIVDSYKWIAGKLKPKKWGETIEVNVNNKMTMVEFLLQNQAKDQLQNVTPPIEELPMSQAIPDSSAALGGKCRK